MLLLSEPTPLTFPHTDPRAGPDTGDQDTGSCAEILSARTFEWLLERERCFADRGERTFGVLLLDFRIRRAGTEAFARRLPSELRATDAVARLHAGRIGLLLPDADLEGIRGAERRIADLAKALGFGFEAASYVYPDIQTASRVRRTRRKPRTAGPARTPPRPEHAGVQDLWSLLSPPVPLWKRAFDVALAALLLLALLPLFAVVALAIRLESEGPVFFRQQRVGRGGRIFTFYKFRSMYADAEARRAELAASNEQDGPIFKMRRDPRMTRIGRWIRRASIDELPQLWNVLRGDFSLVGPRPPTPDEVCRYAPWQRRRLSVPGGLTCLWQVSGRSEIGFEDWMRLDMRYVARRGLWEDLALLARTLPAVLSGRGAY